MAKDRGPLVDYIRLAFRLETEISAGRVNLATLVGSIMLAALLGSTSVLETVLEAFSLPVVTKESNTVVLVLLPMAFGLACVLILILAEIYISNQSKDSPPGNVAPGTPGHRGKAKKKKKN